MSDLQEAGFAAEKIPYQQARTADHMVGGDVSVPLCGEDRVVECKAHKQGFEPAYRALAKADVAVVRGHHREALVIMRLDDWISLVKEYESYRAPPVDGVQVIRFGDAAE